MGPRVVDEREFDESFTGVVLVFEKDENFVRGGEKASTLRLLASRLPGSRLALLYVALATLGLALPNIIVPIFLKIYVDNFLIEGLRAWLAPLLVAMTVTTIVKATLTFLQQNSLARLETKLSISSSAKYFWHVLHLPIQFFAQRFAGDISSRVQVNDRVAALVAGDLATNLANIVLIGFYAALLFQYDVVLTLVGILIAAIDLAALRLVARTRVNANRKLLQEQGCLMGVSMAGLQIVETLKASGAESDYFAYWAGYHTKVINAEQELGTSSQVLSVIPPLLAALNTAAILGLGGLRVMDGVLTMGMLIAFQSLMSSFIDPVNRLVDLGGKMQEAQGDLARLEDTLEYQLDEQFTRETPTLNDDAGRRLDGFLELRNVSFGYNPLEPPLIEDFSLRLSPGQRVALVGASGSGKSTVSKILAGLYEPWEGEVVFDGKHREEIPRTVLTNSIAMVDQDIFLFDGTLRDNLTLWDASVPVSVLVEAARDAEIHDDITRLPNGYDFRVEEGGRNFSGGQRQRLEIARALAGSPRIVILDEATCSLDPRTEKTIDENLRRRGCTCLIVAHRLSTIRDCDEIIVLAGGHIAQRGTHDEMIRVDGPYRRLIEAE
jgi:NHLM bacteriocin system ABC transporter peptidase/ATP-binding protein